jgi:hypothetical protein
VAVDSKVKRHDFSIAAEPVKVAGAGAGNDGFIRTRCHVAAYNAYMFETWSVTDMRLLDIFPFRREAEEEAARAPHARLAPSRGKARYT